jgi:hypothetical protein
MTNHVSRLYAATLALILFFLTWAVVAAQPWSAATSDPRLRALAAREARLRVEARQVNAIVDRRFARYRRALTARRREIAAAKRARAAAATQVAAVRVVTLPPITITRTS